MIIWRPLVCVRLDHGARVALSCLAAAGASLATQVLSFVVLRLRSRSHFVVAHCLA